MSITQYLAEKQEYLRDPEAYKEKIRAKVLVFMKAQGIPKSDFKRTLKLFLGYASLGKINRPYYNSLVALYSEGEEILIEPQEAIEIKRQDPIEIEREEIEIEQPEAIEISPDLLESQTQEYLEYQEEQDREALYEYRLSHPSHCGRNSCEPN